MEKIEHKFINCCTILFPILLLFILSFGFCQAYLTQTLGKALGYFAFCLGAAGLMFFLDIILNSRPFNYFSLIFMSILCAIRYPRTLMAVTSALLFIFPLIVCIGCTLINRITHRSLF